MSDGAVAEPVSRRRPGTRGELRERLDAGEECEVATSVAEMTAIMIEGWLGAKPFVTEPSEKDGWTVFRPRRLSDEYKRLAYAPAGRVGLEGFRRIQELRDMIVAGCLPVDAGVPAIREHHLSLVEGDAVIEIGKSGLQWETGVMVRTGDGSLGVRWDTKFEEGTGMVTSITGGTRKIPNYPNGGH